MRGKIFTAESEYGRRSREENGKEPCALASHAIIFRQLRRLMSSALLSSVISIEKWERNGLQAV